MFEHHRKSPWFAEKYDPSPEFVQLRARVRKEGWKGRMNAFLSDLESGKCDPDLNEPRQDAEPLSPLVSKDGAVNGDAAQTNGSAGEANVIPEDSKPSGSADDAMQFNVEPDEDTNEQDVGRADANGNGRQVSDSKRPVDRGRGAINTSGR